MKHTKTLTPLYIFVITLALMAIACGSSAPADPDAPTRTPRPTATPKIEVELEVINETQNSLCYLLVAPSDEEFNKEYLEGVEIAPGLPILLAVLTQGNTTSKCTIATKTWSMRSITLT